MPELIIPQAELLASVEPAQLTVANPEEPPPEVPALAEQTSTVVVDGPLGEMLGKIKSYREIKLYE